MDLVVVERYIPPAWASPTARCVLPTWLWPYGICKGKRRCLPTVVVYRCVVGECEDGVYIRWTSMNERIERNRAQPALTMLADPSPPGHRSSPGFDVTVQAPWLGTKDGAHSSLFAGMSRIVFRSAPRLGLKLQMRLVWPPKGSPSSADRTVALEYVRSGWPNITWSAAAPVCTFAVLCGLTED